MIGYPLDSHVSYGADGTPIWDRAVSSAALRKLTKKLFSDGVLPNPSTNLQVAAVSGVIVKILSGFALCNGCQKLQEVDLEIQLPSADATYDRIDTVVLRLDDNDDVRACDFMVIKGVAASTPQAPALTQSDSIWEIGLANIYRKANSTEVTNANITDTRYDTSRCGIISSISQFDTKTLYQQIEADLEEFKNVNQADFFTWFESLKNVLSEDVAANLLNLINKLKTEIGKLEDLKTESKVSIVDAINELKNELDNVKVDTLTTMEQVNASTDLEKPVGAGAVQELSNSLVNENSESFNFGYLNGVRGFFTNPSRADDSFIPFSNGVTILGLIVHTDSRSGYVPNTEVTNYYTTGKLTVIDNNAFTYEESNKFVCQKSGTLQVVGAIGIAGGSTYNIIVSKNGVGQTNKATYAKVHFEFDVAEGDVIQVQYDGGAGLWWNTWLTMIL